MTAIIGDAVVRVGGDIITLKQSMAEGSRTVGDFASKSGKHLRKTVNDLGKVGTAAAATGVALLAGITVNATKSGRELQNLSRVANASTKEFQQMSFSAGTFGVEQDKLADILKDVTDRVGDFVQTGGGPMADFFEKIGPKVGVTAENFRNLSGPQALQLFYTSLEKANLSQADMTFYLEAMASDLTALQPLLKNNGQLLNEQARRAEELGLILSDVDLQQLDSGAQSFRELAEITKTVSNLIGVNLVPYVQEVADLLVDSAQEAGGFRQAIDNTVQSALGGFGKVGDVLQGLRVVFKALELVGTGFGAAMISGVQVSLEAFAKFDEAVTWTANKAIDALNTIPGVDIAKIDPFTNSPFMEGMREMADAARSRVGAVRSELANMAMQEMPSDKIEKFLADVAARSQETAAAVVGARQNMVTMPEDEMGGGENADADKIDKELEAIRNKFKTEQQLLEEKYLAEQELLDLALEAKRVSEDEHYDLTESLLWEHQGELTDIEKNAAEKRKQIAEWEAQAKRQAIGKALSDMTTLMNSESRKMFEIGKAAAMGQTIMDTYAGAQAAFTSLAGIPIIGPALGAAAAAAAVLSGVARVRSIRSQSFGGGGGAAATGSNTTAVNAASTPVGGGGGGGGNKTFTLEGFDPNKSYSGGNVRGLLDEIQGAIDNGYKLNLTPGGA